jgi:hypothetical protein
MAKRPTHRADPLGDYTGIPTRQSEELPFQPEEEDGLQESTSATAKATEDGELSGEELVIQQAVELGEMDGRRGRRITDEGRSKAREMILSTPVDPVFQAMISIRPELNSGVLALAAETAEILGWAKGVTIGSQEQNANATENLVFIQGLQRSLEDLRKEYTVPLNDYLKEFNAQFKVFSTPLQEATDVIKGKMIAYKQAEDRKRAEQEELNRQREALQVQEMKVHGELTTDVAPVEVQAAAPSMVRTNAGSAVGGKKWTWTVTDFSKIPDDYKITADQIILKAVQAGKVIPGIEAKQEDTISVRAR